MINIVSVSGGKDSTAALFLALDMGLENITPVAIDVLNEHASWKAYVQFLERTTVPFVWLEADQSWDDLCEERGTFPSRVRQFCTEALKVETFDTWLKAFLYEKRLTVDDVRVIVGYRKEESKKRAAMVERERHPVYGCEVWRPLLDWKLADVIEMHRMKRFPLNPLYHLGAERVGCWPCIYARKSEIAMIARIDPARIEKLAELEKRIGQTMFCIEKSRKGLAKDAPRELIPTPIHGVVKWANTNRKGEDLVTPERSGCARWGMCEGV